MNTALNVVFMYVYQGFWFVYDGSMYGSPWNYAIGVAAPYAT